MGFLPVKPLIDLQGLLDTKKAFGSELFGYWTFFNEDDADSVIQAHVRLTFTLNPNLTSASDTPPYS